MAEPARRRGLQQHYTVRTMCRDLNFTLIKHNSWTYTLTYAMLTLKEIKTSGYVLQFFKLQITSRVKLNLKKKQNKYEKSDYVNHCELRRCLLLTEYQY